MFFSARLCIITTLTWTKVYLANCGIVFRKFCRKKTVEIFLCSQWHSSPSFFISSRNDVQQCHSEEVKGEGLLLLMLSIWLDFHLLSVLLRVVCSELWSATATWLTFCGWGQIAGGQWLLGSSCTLTHCAIRKKYVASSAPTFHSEANIAYLNQKRPISYFS